jgi:hypothetical protein
MTRVTTGIDLDENGRPIPTGGGLAVVFGGLFLCMAVMLFPLSLPGIVQNAECPEATFYSNHIGSLKPVALAIGAVCFGTTAILYVNIWIWKARQSASDSAGQPRAAVTIASIVTIAVASIAVLLGYGVFIDPPKGKSYPVATIDLELEGGQHIPMEFVEKDRFKMLTLKASLKGGNYKYYVNETVTPEFCPRALYDHIWNWLSE